MSKKPIYKRWWFWIVVILVLGGIGVSGGRGSSESDDVVAEETTAVEQSDNITSENEEPEADASQKEKKKEKKKAKEEAKIEYETITVGELMNALDNNALQAAETYKGNYYAVTGKLSNIDAQGDYIDIVDQDDEWAILGVQCYVKTDEVKDMVKTLSKNSVITVKGKITDAGEVLGYSMDIDSIE